ncbi:hypothetical protein Cgig2_027066 [Carnegiea gigantea]|uniref:Bifunctional inhibitor/plant lipid transfer protein/seed storage helical domain-containing protein n=1 Tax=Carnegiea gigantea TaxID=171969 RepID=A0A9Q1QG12_9CARY|nr:hypothetical protein Cgig2_027066 [Carnegiea gigantea]
MGRSSQLIRVLTKVVMMIALCVQIGGMVSSSGDADNALMKECTTEIQQLGNCLMFVTGKEGEPTKECCAAVTAMKDKQPVCLCLFIGQAHNGTNQALKNLELLGISSSSPAASIFMNNNATSSTASNSPSSDPSDGFKLIGNGALLFMSLIASILITIIPIATLEIKS